MRIVNRAVYLQCIFSPASANDKFPFFSLSPWNVCLFNVSPSGSDSESTDLLSAPLCDSAHLQPSRQVVACMQGGPSLKRRNTLLTLSQCAPVFVRAVFVCRHGAGLCVVVADTPGRRGTGVLGSAGKACRTYMRPDQFFHSRAVLRSRKSVSVTLCLWLKSL